jgi:hypothetical protein
LQTISFLVFGTAVAIGLLFWWIGGAALVVDTNVGFCG